ncbi:CYCB1 protein [Gonium pectorale]|uniref:CYCB1 protein n=1 Tax=Gonium pectorale TaxID=33097 RepID=A0A150GT77_GONPE|nr:CYCB1 protein [Gonium pectorale]|eukprot:KXZ53057.1 CYCB1 protein [Gonium pectorale]
MAMRAVNQLAEGENGVVPNMAAKAAVAGGKAGGLTNKRRALGDLSNQQPAAAVGKPGLAKEKATAPAPIPVDGVKTRAAARRADGAVKDAPMPAGATLRPAQLVPRTRAQAAQAQGRAQGPSLSSLLSQRSEAFVGSQTCMRAPPPSPLPDIDSGDRANPLMAADYVNDIYYFYKRVEPKYKVPHDYMTKQTDINDKMRAILIDWLVEVHLKFKLMPETLFLTVNLIDRFLNEKQVTRKNLQLVGVTAMLIASKYEEIWAPEVRDFVYISDRAYTKEQILGMEKVMLNTLKFHLTLPTTYNFLARDLKAANMHFDKDVTMLSSYLIELAQVDAGMLKNNYSLIAVAALHVAMCAYDKPNKYPRELEKHCGYTLEEVMPVASALAELMHKAPNSSLTAVWKKYSSTKYNESAKKAAPAHLLPPQPVA